MSRRRSMMLQSSLPSGYIAHNLNLQLDGEKNTRAGYSSGTRIWEDLSGNGFDFTINDYPVWGENYMQFAKSPLASCMNTTHALSGGSITIELCFQNLSANKSEYGWLFQNRPKNIGACFQVLKSTAGDYRATFLGGNGQSSSNQFTVTDDNLNTVNSIQVVITPTDMVSVFNGTQIQTQTYDANDITAIFGRPSWSIGTALPWSNSTGSALNGRIFALRMYNCALTEQELAHNHELDKRRYGI